MFSREIQFTPISLTPKAGWLETARQSIKLPCAFAMGAVLGFATPGFDQDYLAWFALAPLLVLIRGCQNGLQATLTGFVFGAGYFAIALSFFTGLSPLRWMQIPDILGYQLVFLAWALETCHLSLLFAAFALMVYHLPTRPGFLPHFRRPFYPYLIVVPAIWVFLMWVVSPSPLFFGIPLCQLAYTQSRNLPLIQVAALGGSAAVDFLLVMVNAALAAVVIEATPLVRGMGARTDQFNTKAGMAIDLALSLVCISLIVGWGQFRISHLAEAVRPEKAMRVTPESPPVPIAIVQGNVSIEEERFKTISEAEFKTRYQELSTAQGAALLVLPEGVVTANQDKPGADGLKEVLRAISANEKKEVIYGAVEPLKEGYANSAKLLSPFRLPGTTYIKQKLVPFGESIPINLIYQKIPEDLREKIPASKERFLEDKQARLLTSGFGKVGVAICNEIVYPKLVSDEVRKGASLLVCLANLGWFHNSSLGKQFLACATLRAVENKRYLILSTNTGISSVIDPLGMVVSRSYALKRGILLDTVQFIYSRTPYNRMRWL
ncbi:MAG: apolipoprotein N-acyltransferase [Candidatus Melainabacteria bacterium]|nr:apolipoprotein N-acyltransferase [Candidatus Melainabacteria bacterium]